MNSRMVSVILPAYNDKQSLLALIPAVHDALAAYEHEIVVVDDNSPDGTYQALLASTFAPADVKVILRETDRGLAKSIRCGIEHASGDILVVMDSDFNHLPKYIPIMIDNLKYFECVIASRFLYFPLEQHDSVFRIVTSWMFNLFIRIVLFSAVTENLFGFFAIRRDVIDRMNFDRIFFGFGDYFIRLLFYLQKANVSILQIPAVFARRHAGTGNKNVARRIIRYTKETFVLRLSNL
jgi:dolichol-phosphate mannosyltransferase